MSVSVRGGERGGKESRDGLRGIEREKERLRKGEKRVAMHRIILTP